MQFLLYALYVALYCAGVYTAYWVGLRHGRGEKAKQTPFTKPKRSYDL